MSLDVHAYGKTLVPHLEGLMRENQDVMERVTDQLVDGVQAGQSLFAYGNGHSALFPLELFHRAGGVSFLIPIVADFTLPSAGPQMVRTLERTPGFAKVLLDRAAPEKDEMIWIVSQSGINGAVIDMALEAKKVGLKTVAFSSLVHSKAVQSRHESGKRLFEVCDEVVDLGGYRGDASIALGADPEAIKVGPLSTMSAAFLGHSILVSAASRLEEKGVRCVYTSVNTPEGEARNRSIEETAKKRCVLLR